jgi:glycosyltransferase involved in cell wall biosynthesis
MANRKRILLFSTLNPYPHWAGSENLWYDLVRDTRTVEHFEFTVQLAASPVTQKKAQDLMEKGVGVHFYRHHNVHFIKRNIQKLKDRLLKRSNKTLPWYNVITDAYDLVFFNVAALADLADLIYAVEICIARQVPYVLLLQHGYEDFFFSSAEEMEKTRVVAMQAKHFIFISHRNRRSLERALGQELSNAFHTVNAIPAEKLSKAVELGKSKPVGRMSPARFFNLGRFSPRDKAQHLLLEALSTEKWKERDWRLSFIGVSGFGREALETLIKFYKIEPARIRIVPHTENVLVAITDEDVLLMPSLSEGTPFAMVESMACGRPALGTPVGGIPELISEGKTGWLSNACTAGAIGEQLDLCWKERDRWKEYGSNAQQYVTAAYNEDVSFPPLVDILKQDCK